MLSSFIRSPALLISLPLLALIASSHQANAEIYKWRDDRGVTQYSDRPPVSSFTKVTRNEMVNALQTKDLCTVGPIQKSVASTKNINTFFGFTVHKQNAANTSSLFKAPIARSAGITGSTGNSSNARFINTRFTNAVSDTAAPNTSIASRSTSTIAAVNSARVSAPVVKTARPATQVSPLGIASILNNGNDKITVFGIPRTNIVANNNLLTPKAIQPTPLVIATAPVSVATAPAQVTKAPTQLAVNTPAESNTSNPSPNLIQVGLMPAVDVSKNITPALGWDDLRIRPNLGPQDVPRVGDGNGQFRIDCEVSHMSNDDPILYPNQQSAAHHHTFFGNTSVNHKSNLMTLSTTGTSTCRGGIANRSAYWVPSMIDTASKTPLKPYSALWYYKTGYKVAKEKITAPPKGLRMIVGNMKATNSASSTRISYSCFKEGEPGIPSTIHIPACSQGWTIVTHVDFPQCWDGKNLSSPDNISHMSDPVNNACPATHPVAIPKLGLNTKYLITTPEGTKNWRLSSDNYAANGYNAGYSGHADWVNGWDEKVIAGIVKNCLNAGKDCGNHMLGDDTVIYGQNRNF